jgi:hypothetical protein
MDAPVVTIQRGVHASPNLFPPRFARTAHIDDHVDVDAGTNDSLGITLRHLVVVIIQAGSTGSETITTDFTGRVALHRRDGIDRTQTYSGRNDLG